MKKKVAVFSPELAKKILDKLGITDGFERQTPIDPKKLLRDNEFHDKNAQIYKSDSDDFIPPYACMRVVGSEFSEEMNTDVVLVDKPNGTHAAFVFNGMYTVFKGEYANCYTGEVRCITGQEVEEAGVAWGAKSDWIVEPDGIPSIKVYGDGVGRTIDAGVSEVFVIELIPVGGEDGTAEFMTRWRYDIKLAGQDSILEADVDLNGSPHIYRRTRAGSYTKASYGLACYLNGELSVVTTNEVPNVGTCSTTNGE